MPRKLRDTKRNLRCEKGDARALEAVHTRNRPPASPTSPRAAAAIVPCEVYDLPIGAFRACHWSIQGPLGSLLGSWPGRSAASGRRATGLACRAGGRGRSGGLRAFDRTLAGALRTAPSQPGSRHRAARHLASGGHDQHSQAAGAALASQLGTFPPGHGGWLHPSTQAVPYTGVLREREQSAWVRARPQMPRTTGAEAGVHGLPAGHV